MVTHFCSLWFAIANTESQDAYDEAIAVLRKEAPARFVDYVEQTLLPYALKFVAFHTNKTSIWGRELLQGWKEHMHS